VFCWDAPSDQDAGSRVTSGHRGDRLPDKSAFADARRTDDGDHARLTGGDHVIEQGGNRIQVKPASDERGISWHVPFGYRLTPG
jgi:hypothetical protein